MINTMIPIEFFKNTKLICGWGGCDLSKPGDLISLILPNLLIGAGVIFLFLMVGAGFTMISSAGSGDAKSAAQAKTTVTYSVIGFLLVISAYFILQAIGVITGIDFLKIQNL